MTLFKTPTAQEIWLEHHCDRCYLRHDCKILEKALRTDRKPPQWDRNTRAQLMQDAYRCNEFRRTPPRGKPRQQFEDVSMFGDDTPYRVDVGYVPVDGWPDKPNKKETDHA
jgi:hypothetical protein